GLLNLSGQLTRRPAGGWDAKVTYKPQGLSARYHRIPYPMRQGWGEVVAEMVSDQPGKFTLDFNAVTEAGGAAAFKGVRAGGENNPAVHLDIIATKMPISPTLIHSLPERYQTTAASFRLRGYCDLVAHIRRNLESADVPETQVRCFDYHDQYTVTV